MNKKNRGFNAYFVLIFLLMALLIIPSLLDNNQVEYTRGELIEDLEAGKIIYAVITPSRETPTGEVDFAISNEPSKTLYVTDVSEIEELLISYGIDPEVKKVEEESWFLTSVFPVLLAVVVMVFFFVMMNSQNAGGGSNKMMNFGKSRAKMSMGDGKITLKDVAGLKEEKEELEEIVEFLKDPAKFTKVGARIPKGVLLEGAPGTGKTLLAKAIAGEAGVPFFSISGSDFVEMFVGVGASRVRDLFKQAQSMAPCIIFIDEVDAIGKSRDTAYGGGNDEREQTLNALLAEMDGFDSSKGLVILAATNRPEVLDKALLRPGRFDRRVIVERPDLKGRVETLKVHARNVLMDDSVDFDEIALATSGAVGSDLANMINEAALGAVKAGREVVTQKDLLEAVEVVIAGKEKKDRILGDEEKRIVAYHEVGHALTIAVQKHTEPVQKITIVPRTMGALGYTMTMPEEERYLMSKEQMLNELVGLFGGRAAEDVVFNSVTTGASNDIERATKIARAMVTQYGMSETFGLMGLESVQSRYLDGRPVLNCSDATEALIDEEVKNILKNAYDKALSIIREHRAIMDEIAEFLIEKETITGKEFMEIFSREQKQEEIVSEITDSEEKEVDPEDTTEMTEKNPKETAEEKTVVISEEKGTEEI